MTLEQRLALAAAHVQARQSAGDCPDVDPETWCRVVVQHLEPLPSGRLWLAHSRQRLRHRPAAVSLLAPAVARSLTPEQGHQPQPHCIPACAATHNRQDVA